MKQESNLKQITSFENSNLFALLLFKNKICTLKMIHTFLNYQSNFFY